MNNYSFLEEASFLKDMLASTHNGIDLRKETANAVKIINKYPTPEALIKKLTELQQQVSDHRQSKKLRKCIEDLQDDLPMDKEEYYEFVRKRLSGASGFWKHVLYATLNAATFAFNPLIAPVALPVGWGSKIYKSIAAQKSIENDDADDVIKKHTRDKIFFRDL